MQLYLVRESNNIFPVAFHMVGGMSIFDMACYKPNTWQMETWEVMDAVIPLSCDTAILCTPPD